MMWATYPTPMKSLKWIIAAVVVVALIATAANGFFLHLLASEDLETSILDVGVEIGDPEELGFVVEVPEQSGELSFGSSVEVYRFVLETVGPYSIRYLSFAVDWAGLRNETIAHPSAWKLYKVVDGEVDYLDTIGVAESIEDGVLKMRFSSSRGTAFLGEGGDEFALVTSVLSDPGSDEEPQISVGISGDDWAWVPGIYEGSWMSLEEKYGAEGIAGLPGRVVEKW